jgi:hypothetical protein
MTLRDVSQPPHQATPLDMAKEPVEDWGDIELIPKAKWEMWKECKNDGVTKRRFGFRHSFVLRHWSFVIF